MTDAYRVPTRYADGSEGPPIALVTPEDVDRYRAQVALDAALKEGDE